MSNEVIAATIAGSVSVIVSGIAGIYTIIRNKRQFDNLKKELLTKSITEDFIKARIKYLDDFRSFEPKFVGTLNKTPEDGTAALQLLIDFFDESAKDYYIRNKTFLKTTKLEELLEKINCTIESRTLSNNENHKERRNFGEDLLSFCKELNEQSLKQN